MMKAINPQIKCELIHFLLGLENNNSVYSFHIFLKACPQSSKYNNSLDSLSVLGQLLVLVPITAIGLEIRPVPLNDRYTAVTESTDTFYL